MVTFKYYVIKYYLLYVLYAWVPERPKGKDLRSFGIGLRGFESLPMHYFIILYNFLIPDCALVAQVVERYLGKVEVGGSNPP